MWTPYTLSFHIQLFVDAFKFAPNSEEKNQTGVLKQKIFSPPTEFSLSTNANTYYWHDECCCVVVLLFGRQKKQKDSSCCATKNANQVTCEIDEITSRSNWIPVQDVETSH